MAFYEVQRDDETLDAIVYKFYNGEFGYLEQVLAANVFLSKGLTIYLPDLSVSQAQSRITLWN